MKFGKTLTHPRETDPAAVAFAKAPQSLGRNTVAIILHQQDRDIVLATEVDDHALRGGMAVDVGERFLENAKESDLRIPMKPVDKIIDVELNLETAPLRKTFHVPAQRGSQGKLIEQRRMQDIGEGANVVVYLLREIGGLNQGFADIETGAIEALGQVTERLIDLLITI